MKFNPTLLIALLLAPAWPLHAADLSLLSEGKSDYQIVVPDSLETPALTECLNQTARLVQTTFAENGAEVAVVTESQRDATKPALLLGNTRFRAASNRPTSKSTAMRSSIHPSMTMIFELAVRTAQAEFDKHQPPVVVGSSRGGAVAMNICSGNAKLVLLCPAWKNWGTAKTVRSDTVVLHSRADDVIPFADSEELGRNSGAKLIEVGNDHRLADRESLAAMLSACEVAG